eukprot:scaffold330_cov246-Pinguiococcus_pyrenoidosus.AAC.26
MYTRCDHLHTRRRTRETLPYTRRSKGLLVLLLGDRSLRGESALGRAPFVPPARQRRHRDQHEYAQVRAFHDGLIRRSNIAQHHASVQGRSDADNRPQHVKSAKGRTRVRRRHELGVQGGHAGVREAGEKRRERRDEKPVDPPPHQLRGRFQKRTCSHHRDGEDDCASLSEVPDEVADEKPLEGHVHRTTEGRDVACPLGINPEALLLVEGAHGAHGAADEEIDKA